MQNVQERFFGIIGKLALQYSNMEAVLREILDVMVHPTDALAAGLVTDDMHLEKRIRKINQLAEYRLTGQDELLARCRALMKRVEATRVERNDLVHGQWKYNATGVAKGIIVCVDNRWRQMKSPNLTKSRAKHWSSDHQKAYKIDELSDRVGVVTKLVVDLLKFRDEVLNTAFKSGGGKGVTST